jgi:hypothetical protein
MPRTRMIASVILSAGMTMPPLFFSSLAALPPLAGGGEESAGFSTGVTAMRAASDFLGM